MQLSRTLSFFLALAILSPATTQTHTSTVAAVASVAPKMNCGSCHSKKLKLAILAVCAAGSIRLTTKPTAKNQTQRSWEETFSKLAGVLNITKLFTAEYWENFDAIIIGDQFKLIDIDKETTEDGVTITRHDKEVKSLPTGVLGNFHAYVLLSLKAIFQHIDNLEKLSNYFDGICFF